MPAKNKRRRSGADPHSDLLAHMTAYRRAEEWAQKCQDLRTACKTRQATECERKTRHWLRRALNIEARRGPLKAFQH
jgi:hypothetical protein